MSGAGRKMLWRKNEVLGEKPVPVPFCPPKSLHVSSSSSYTFSSLSSPSSSSSSTVSSSSYYSHPTILLPVLVLLLPLLLRHLLPLLPPPSPPPSYYMEPQVRTTQCLSTRLKGIFGRGIGPLHGPSLQITTQTKNKRTHALFPQAGFWPVTLVFERLRCVLTHTLHRSAHVIGSRTDLFNWIW